MKSHHLHLKTLVIALLCSLSALAQSTDKTYTNTYGEGIDTPEERTAFKGKLTLSSDDIGDATSDGQTNHGKILKTDGDGNFAINRAIATYLRGIVEDTNGTAALNPHTRQLIDSNNSAVADWSSPGWINATLGYGSNGWMNGNAEPLFNNNSGHFFDGYGNANSAQNAYHASYADNVTYGDGMLSAVSGYGYDYVFSNSNGHFFDQYGNANFANSSSYANYAYSAVGGYNFDSPNGFTSGGGSAANFPSGLTSNPGYYVTIPTYPYSSYVATTSDATGQINTADIGDATYDGYANPEKLLKTNSDGLLKVNRLVATYAYGDGGIPLDAYFGVTTHSSYSFAMGASWDGSTIYGEQTFQHDLSVRGAPAANGALTVHPQGASYRGIVIKSAPSQAEAVLSLFDNDGNQRAGFDNVGNYFLLAGNNSQGFYIADQAAPGGSEKRSSFTLRGGYSQSLFINAGRTDGLAAGDIVLANDVTGNVGIGIGSPTAKLEVNGDTLLDGDATITGQAIAPNQTAATGDAVMTRDLIQDHSARSTNLNIYPAFITNSYGTGASAATSSTGLGYPYIYAGTMAGGYSHAVFSTIQQGLNYGGFGTYFSTKFRVSGSFCINAADLTADGKWRFFVGADASPTMAASADMFTVRGIGFEVDPQSGTGERVRITYHDGTTYKQSAWHTITSVFYNNENTSFMLENIGNGTVNLYMKVSGFKEGPQSLKGESPILTITDGPTGGNSQFQQIIAWQVANDASTYTASMGQLYPTPITFDSEQ